MGVFEIPSFAEGTKRVAQAMAECKGVTIVGGGDSAAAVEKFGRLDILVAVMVIGVCSFWQLLSQVPGP